MKKIVLSFVLIITFLFIPVIVFATENNVVKVGNDEYETLDEAINSIDAEGTVTLLSNVTLSNKIVIQDGKKITLDLNGYNISAPEQTINVDGAMLNVIGEGTIKELSPNYAPICIFGSDNPEDKDYTVVTIGNGVTLEGWSGIMLGQSQNYDLYGVKLDFDGKINSVLDTNGKTGYGIFVSGNFKGIKNSPIITIGTNANIKSEGVGLFSGGYSNWTINGGTINTVESGFGIKSGIITINNVNIICTGPDKTPTPSNNSGINPSGAAIHIESHTDYAGQIELTIKNGEFTSQNGVAFYEHIGIGSSTQVKKITIENGIFNSADGKESISVSDEFSSQFLGFVKGGEFKTDVTKFVEDGFICNSIGDRFSISLPAIESIIPIVNPNSGYDEIAIGIEEIEKTDNILENSLKANNELSGFARKNNIVIELKIEDAEISVKEFTKKVENVLSKESKNVKVADFWDITIAVTANSKEIGTLSELTEEVKFSLILSEELKNVPEGYKRTFYILREHNGKILPISTSLSEDGSLINFSSKQFSTFALAYNDEKIENSDTNIIDNVPEEVESNPNIPNTGDNFVLSIIIASLSIVIIFVVVISKNKHKK